MRWPGAPRASDRLVELAAELGNSALDRLSRRFGGVGRRGNGVVDREPAGVDLAPQPGDLEEARELVVDEGAVADLAVPGHDRPANEIAEPRHGLGPVERVAVAEVRRRAGLEEVAGEQHAGVAN